MASVRRFLAMGGMTLIGLPLAGVGLGGAAADATTVMQCNGSGTIAISSAHTPFKWKIHLTGVSCQASTEASGGTLTGSGTSDSLGLCGESGRPGKPPFTVKNLNIPVTEKLTGYLGTTITNEVWSASSTTFPSYTPFQIVRNGTTVGAGLIRTHIISQCPPMGTPSAYVTWTEPTG